MAKKTESKSTEPKVVTGYKALRSDFTCNGHQYAVGKTYTHEGPVKMCNSGYHFCEYPLSVLNYYDLIGSRFAEIESDDVRETKDDKSVAGRITVKKEIGIKDMIAAQVALVFSFCFTKSGAPKADSKETASSEKYAQLASSGDGAQLASSGDGAQLASSGYGAKLASSGDGAQLASSGDGAQLASSGYGAKLEVTGPNSVVAGIGINNSASGAEGSWITLAEWEYTGKSKTGWVVRCVKTEQVDGKRIKAGVAYKLEKGAFVVA